MTTIICDHLFQHNDNNCDPERQIASILSVEELITIVIYLVSHASIVGYVW
jgi:hypothetical protein